METYKLLIVDDDDVIRRNLVNYLTKFHKAPYKVEVDSAESVREAVEKLEEKLYHLAIIDINMPEESGFNLVEIINRDYPDVKTAMITAYKVEDYLRLAREKGVSNIIVKTAPFNFDELSNVIHGLLMPDEFLFGLHNYLDKETNLLHHTVDNSDSISKVQSILRECMITLNLANVELLSIAILEAITNALYHAPRSGGGQKKYERGALIDKLDTSEVVKISYGWDAEKLGISITDQSGNLSRNDVLYWLERNVKGTNILDTSGRGFYLMHCIVDRLIINIKQEQMTEIILLIYLKDTYSGHKPVYINEI
jgi:CheY-like chemotaxis protein